MCEPLSVAANIVGLAVPALHGIRLLVNDVERLVDAPKSVARLQEDLLAVSSTLESMQAIGDAEWASVGEQVVVQSKTAIATCTKACETFRGDLQRWTKRSRDGKLSWRDRAKIGFFKEQQIKAMSQHLQSCKLTCGNVVGLATLFISVRNTQLTEDVKSAVIEKEAALSSASKETEARLEEVEAALNSMNLAGATQQDGSDSEDLTSAVSQLEEEIVALKSAQLLLAELLCRVKEDEVEKMAKESRTAIVNTTFGSNNSGFQVGVSYGSISGVHLGRFR